MPAPEASHPLRRAGAAPVLAAPAARRSVWWLSPFYATLFLLIPAAVAIVSYQPRYVTLGYNYLSSAVITVLMVGLCAFALGAALPLLAAPPRRPSRTGYVIDPAYLDFLATVGILAYLVWFRQVLFDPKLALAVLSGAQTDVRGDINTIPGITTLAQLGVSYAALYATNLASGGRVPRRQHIAFGVFLVLALARSVLWSERLAFIEFLVPAGVWLAVYFAARGGRAMRLGLALLPFGAGILAFLFFAGEEYFRSWTYYRVQYPDFWSFMIDRWIIYYLSSLNNGAFLVTHLAGKVPDLALPHLLAPVYELPGIGPWFTRVMHQDFNGAAAQSMLQMYLDPEFNVFSGVFPILFDLGYVGGTIFLALLGMFFGAMYRGFTEGRGLGYVLYPVIYIALLEFLRIPYLFTTRTVYIVLGCVIAYLAFRRPIAVRSPPERSDALARHAPQPDRPLPRFPIAKSYTRMG